MREHKIRIKSTIKKEIFIILNDKFSGIQAKISDVPRRIVHAFRSNLQKIPH